MAGVYETHVSWPIFGVPNGIHAINNAGCIFASILIQTERRGRPSMNMKAKAKKLVVAHSHTEDGDTVTAALNVLVCPAEEGGFIAQGIEIDYLATGATEELAREHFAEGFAMTVATYLSRQRPLDGLFKTRTPAAFIQQYFASPSQPVFVCLVEQKQLPKTVGIPKTLAFHRADCALA